MPIMSVLVADSAGASASILAVGAGALGGACEEGERDPATRGEDAGECSAAAIMKQSSSNVENLECGNVVGVGLLSLNAGEAEGEKV